MNLIENYNIAKVLNLVFPCINTYIIIPTYDIIPYNLESLY